MFKRFSRRGVLAGAAALATAAFLGLAGVADAVAQQGGGGRRTVVIGLIAKSQGNPVFIAARTGAEDAARELGEKMNLNIRIDWRTPVAEDAQRQAEFVEQLVNAGADGIAISCTDAKVATMAINSAVAKGVPVATFDSDAPESRRFVYFGTDDMAAGKALAAEMARVLNGEGVVAILAGNQNAPNLQARVRGVREGLSSHSGIRIQDVYYHIETPQDAVARIEQVQAANPQITGWIFVGGWPLYTDNALARVQGRAKVVSLDTLPQALTYLENGQVEVLLGQQVYEWGYESVRMLVEKITKDKAPASPIVNADLVRVTQENVAEYRKNWDKWMPRR